ncbi:MAG: hypothetical protein ACYDG2_03895 [Ruminiclostridium sp.]
MERVYVDLTHEEKERLTLIAANYKTTPGELLAAFSADLTYSNRTGGSDERMYADQWLERQTYRWFDGKLC